MFAPKDGNRPHCQTRLSHTERLVFVGIVALFAFLFWWIFTTNVPITEMSTKQAGLTAATYDYSSAPKPILVPAPVIVPSYYYSGAAPVPCSAASCNYQSAPYYYATTTIGVATTTAATTTSLYPVGSTTVPAVSPANPTNRWYMPGAKFVPPPAEAAQSPAPSQISSADNSRGLIQRVKNIFNVAYKFFFGAGAPVASAPPTAGNVKSRSPKDAGSSGPSCAATGNCALTPFLDLTHYDSVSDVSFSCVADFCPLGGGGSVPSVPKGSGTFGKHEIDWERKTISPYPKNIGSTNTNTESEKITKSWDCLDAQANKFYGPDISNYNYNGYSGKGSVSSTGYSKGSDDWNAPCESFNNTTDESSERFNPSAHLTDSFLTSDIIGPANGTGNYDAPDTSSSGLSMTYTSVIHSKASLMFLNGNPSLTYSVPLLVAARPLTVLPNYDMAIVSRAGDNNISCDQITVAGQTAVVAADGQCLVSVIGTGGAIVDVTPSIPSIPFYEYNLNLDYSPPPLLSAVIKTPRNVKFSVIYPVSWAKPPIPGTQYFQVERAVGAGGFASLKNIYPGDASINPSKYADEITDNLDITLPTPAPKLSYRVRAMTETGWSDWSNVATIESPTDLAAKMPDPLKGSDPKNGDPVKVKLNWTDNTPGKENGFQIERAVDAKNSVFQAVGTTAANAVSAFDDLSSATSIASPQIAYRVRAILPDSTFSDNTNTASVSSCVHISGNGPRKVVFLIGDLLRDKGVSNLIAYANNDIEKGFKKIDPFKSYIGAFSFYADTMIQSEDAIFKSLGNAKDITQITKAVKSIENRSSCGGDGNQYIYYLGTVFRPFSLPTMGVSFISIPIIISGVLGKADQEIVTVHETAHAVAGLFDEYKESMWGDFNLPLQLQSVLSTENCSTKPSWDYRNKWDNRVYGEVTDEGCTYLMTKNSSGSQHPVPYHRPSKVSIMGYTTTNSIEQDRFNVVSCGYLIAAIKGEPVDKAHAETHWKECVNLDTIKDGIPRHSSTPSISPQSSNFISSGVNMTIAGSGFTATDNAVQIVSASDSSKIYDIPGLPSADGTTITFSVPANISSGIYTMKVGAFNSDWSSPVNITIKASGKTKNPSPANTN